VIARRRNGSRGREARLVKRFWIWAPLGVFVVFVLTVAWSLYRPDDRLHPSQMIGKPFPATALPAGASDRPAFAGAVGTARLVNVFASWCVPCIAEARVLGDMAASGVRIDGVAIRDKRADVDRFLAKNGNPYRTIGLDADSTVQIAIGSSGVPETFVVDGKGIIRFQHIGEITPADVSVVLAKLREAQ
jgi:cytochrome c biogenesis protein CcmG, thiol:disulfide interchange protein DsbE